MVNVPNAWSGWLLFPLRHGTLWRLAVVGILAPIAFLVGYSLFLLGPGRQFADTEWGLPVLFGIAGSAVLVFAVLMFGAVGMLQRNVERISRRLSTQNAQLRALNSANLSLAREMLTETVLQNVADLSRELVGVRYGALSVLDDEGNVTGFHISGMDKATHRRIGDPPVGKGLLKALKDSAVPMTVESISDHPASVGFPEGHPPMKTLLGVPIVSEGRSVGTLYLCDKEDGEMFTDEDVEIAQLFANQAAVALRNARLYAEVQALAVERERVRISHEMHDGLAQMLGFVNAKTQAVEALMARDRTDEARVQLKELSGAAREMYRDVREGILALRTQVTSEMSFGEALTQYLEEFEHQSGLNVTQEWHVGFETMRLHPTQEVQVVRIVQEALTNVRKHAQATHVSIEASESEPGCLKIEIRDDGSGFNREAVQRRGTPHFGLQTMRERAEAIGGSLTVEGVDGEGTTVSLLIPEAVESGD